MNRSRMQQAKDLANMGEVVVYLMGADRWSQDGLAARADYGRLSLLAALGHPLARQVLAAAESRLYAEFWHTDKDLALELAADVAPRVLRSLMAAGAAVELRDRLTLVMRVHAERLP